MEKESVNAEQYYFEKDQERPSGRIFHSFTAVQNGQIILIGGIELDKYGKERVNEDVYVFHTGTQQWTKLQKNKVLGDQFEPRYGHSTSYYKDNNLLVFGGCVDVKEGKLADDDLYLIKYDTRNSQFYWKKEKIEGQKPEPRAACGLVVSDKKWVILYGGNDRSIEKTLSDIWVLNLGSLTPSWSLIEHKKCPIQGRYALSISLIKKEDQQETIIIFGGKNEDQQAPRHDYFQLKLDEDQFLWKLRQYRRKPNLEARYYHNSLTYESKLINFGGLNPGQQLSSSLEIYDLSAELPVANLALPFGICQMSSVLFDKKIIYFGGEDGSVPRKPLNDLIEIDIQEYLDQTYVPQKQTVVESPIKEKVQTENTLLVSNYKQRPLIREKAQINYGFIIQPLNVQSQEEILKKSPVSVKSPQKEIDLSELKLEPFASLSPKNNTNNSQKKDINEKQVQEDEQLNEDYTNEKLNEQMGGKFFQQMNKLILNQSSSFSVSMGITLEFQTDQNQFPQRDSSGKYYQRLKQLCFFQNTHMAHNQLLEQLMNPHDQQFRQLELENKYPRLPVMDMLDYLTGIIEEEPTVLQINGRTQVFGDISGNFNDLMRLFHYGGSIYEQGTDDNPEKYNYLFLGNYVDGGVNSVDVIILLFCLQLRFPKQIYLLRGSHEDESINKKYGFEEECKFQFEEKTHNHDSVYQAFNKLFDLLPLAAVIEDKFFCCHGGIGPQVITHFKDLQELNRPVTNIYEQGKPSLNQRIVRELLWSVPYRPLEEINQPKVESHDALFDQQTLQKFLNDNNLNLLIRSHQKSGIGHETFHDGLGCTVYSCFDKDEKSKNLAAFLIIEQVDKKLTITPQMIYPRRY